MDWIPSRFDVAGATGAAGACLKRYTDPSFFKLEWASSELMKAQRAQREKKPHRDKKKGRRRLSSGQPKMTTQIPSRVHYGVAASVADFDSLPHHHHLASSLKVEKPDVSQQQLPASHSAAGFQKWRSSAAVVPTAVVAAAEESSVGLLGHTSGTASILEIAASEEALPNEPFKRSARDNEAATISDKAKEIKREETKDGSDALSVASASVLVGMEDHEAANVHIHASRYLSGEATEATAIADQISGGNLREDIVEVAAAGMGGGMPSRYESKEEEIVPTSMAEKISWKISMEEELEEAVHMIRKLSSHSLKDVGEAAAHMSAEEALIHASVDVNDGAPAGKILRQSSLELSEVSNQGGSFSQQSSDEDGDNVVVAAALNTMGSDDECDLEAHAQGLPVVSESYEVANPIPHHDTLKLSHLQQTAIAEKPQHDETKIDPNCIHQTTSPVSGTVSGGPSSSSISSDESERPMAELEKTLHSHQQGIIGVTRALERENFELTPSRDGLTHNMPHGLDVPEVHNLHIEEISSATLDQVQKESEVVGHDQQSPSATIPGIWMPGKPTMEPRVSDLSRFSYSSSCSLMSVSSYSAHSSPSTPKSPVVNVMPSPSSGLPLSTTCQETLDYPWGFLDSLSFKGSSSSESDPGDPSSPIKSPILLSLPLTSSSSPYIASVPPLEQEENPSPNDSVPSNLMTPSQTPPPFPVFANPALFCSSSPPKLYPLHNPPQFLEPDLQEPDLQHSQVNCPPEKELTPSSVSRANLESMHQDPLDAGIELQPSLSSMLPTNTTLSLLKSAPLSKPMSSEPGRLTSILLPLGTSDSPKSCSAPLTPAASPQHSSPQPSSPCCESSAALPTPASPDSLSSQSSSPGSYRWNGAQSSALPSPTGTVIIKDSRSPSVSPVSNDSLHGPRSVPELDAPLGSHTHSPLRSPSAQLNLAFRTSPAGNLDYKDGNCAQQGTSTVLLETQEPRLSRSLDLNASNRPGAIDPDDFGEGWNWPNFALRTGEIPHRKSHSNSPPQSVWLESSSSQLRWQSRPELVPKLPLKLVIPDFFLPPNLAPGSPDSTSPSFSPCPSEAHSHTLHKESPSHPSETCSNPIVVADLPSKSAAVPYHDPAERPESEHNVKLLSQPAAIPELNNTSIPETHALLQASDSIEPATTMTRPLHLFCPPPPPSAGEFVLRKTADETRDSSASAAAAAATAIAADDRNMVAFQELGKRLVPPTDHERQVIFEQIRTKSFNLRHTEKKKEPVVQPLTNINVAVILEKANAIRQAFAGSDEEDEWSDS